MTIQIDRIVTSCQFELWLLIVGDRLLHIVAVVVATWTHWTIHHIIHCLLHLIHIVCSVIVVAIHFLS